MSDLTLLDRLKNAVQGVNPKSIFHVDEYMRINQRRLEHLASLGLPLAGRSVLEVGAGIGDHTSFFLDRGCAVCVTEPRRDNLAIIERRYPGLDVRQLNLDDPPADFPVTGEIVYAYGVLYHLKNPGAAIAFMAEHCTDMMLVETCVSFGSELAVNPVKEPARLHSQALTSVGCRPTRTWVANELRAHFAHVYFPRTQPFHEEFPIDWSGAPTAGRSRAVFVASRRPLDIATLTQELPMVQSHQ